VTLYIDSSALAKLFLDEPESDDIARAVEEAGVRATSRLTYVECGAAFGRAERIGRMSARQLARTLGALDQAWQDILVVEVDEDVAAAAVAIALGHPVRASDAIHLASARAVASTERAVTFACFDRRLWEVAGSLGMERLPADL
jgi:predicted nucleic acid-binding protein